ncbi:MAG: hypothetical protein JNK64_25810 [Myxococcales bacterium]|nr:hypothetical protein [Myxococcales bacterium]
MRTLMLWLAVVLAVAAPRRAVAEINMADSVEWMTADADLVVRGQVAAVASRPGQAGWYDVTVQVAEALKGAPAAQVIVAIPQGAVDPLAWQTRHAELLLFLVEGKRRVADDAAYGQAALALRRGERAAVVLDGASVGPLFDRRFAVLDQRGSVLAAVRAAATSRATRAHQIDLPYDAPAFQALYGGSAVWFYLPVDAQLEKLARTWIASTDVLRREEGVAALAYFPTAANRRLLARLLADPGYATVSGSDQPPVRRFLVRQRAHQVLAQWQVRHATPVIDQPIAP